MPAAAKSRDRFTGDFGILSLHHFRRLPVMIYRKELPALRLLIGCTLCAYVAGEHLQFSKAPAQQVLGFATASSTGSIAAVTFNPSTFAKVEPPRPVVLPGDLQQQG
jgi:hypothetical protein